MTDQPTIPSTFGKRIAEALHEESDRACVILTQAWADHFLRMRLKMELSGGNSNAREQLFASNGPFATFSAKLNVSYCAGWIDADVFHDLQIIRRMRNQFAHSVEAGDLHDDEFRHMVDKLQVPTREYYDWEDIEAAEIEDGVILYSDDPRPDVSETLSLAKIKFRMAATILFAVLLENLKIPIDFGPPKGVGLAELAEHMKGG